jgi:hypothetical protein
MKIRPSLALLLAAFILPATLAESGAAADRQPRDDGDIRIELNDDLLSAEIRNASLPQVLTEIGKLAGFKVVRVDDFDDFPRIDSKFESLPLEAAVKRLVADTNSIFFYSAEQGGGPGRRLSQLWLLGPGEAGPDLSRQDQAIDGLQNEEPLIRSQAVLRLVQQEGEEAALEKLSLMLQTDQDPLVRSRVAIALGALGDERAVPELEAALQDPNSSVRAQSITALGHIGGDRATMALGSILTDVNIDSVERVMAAQALWKLDSEIARSYLQAGSSDNDDQVREASRKAPSNPEPAASEAAPAPEVTE